MKTLGISLLFAASLPAFAQKMGDPVTIDAFGKSDWVQGEAPATWEPGKLYIIECWATWCGPCVAAIPHVDELYDKYYDQGLRVIGMNVWEDGKSKVVDFVKDKGEGMSYPVAYVGKGGTFEETWLKPAEVRGIPHAFVVQDGKVLFTCHPMQLSEEVIENLLKGGEVAETTVTNLMESRRKQEATGKVLQSIMQASAQKDAPALHDALEELRKIDPNHGFLATFGVDYQLLTEDWDGAASALSKDAEKEQPAISMMSIAKRLVELPESPNSLRSTVAELFTKQLEAKTVHPLQYTVLSKLEWAMGEKDAAKASAQKALDWTHTPEGAEIPSEPFEKLTKSLDEGVMPSDDQMQAWFQEATAKRQPTANG
ncbi:thiol-disulfide isomerase/thioredoxin [Haloferula luteola]|uniref:Thiol-disulfide isomerase/thioredoxin n=1 Tax=Haloferula luteola TaxID=595692 RepID=A0A840V5H1_9BACT|nr:TlpA disulfide reductase family protein [Haloferula luteola]MBB5352276.1 thiol-disulfide isomerase/thioredoxin [Haloferula luteola]